LNEHDYNHNEMSKEGQEDEVRLGGRDTT
jgi:hypothetical protein